ncbi:MAG: prepilin-type N-terminal cleavage/methylation domain-containing protein [Candidatus Thiodiazotropha sp. (ex Semelilucina semeliformis)]|nr:prepilin-type N-terminal cleavage/methylation domain-containing protein [Candidatus Thiodiazotropha sp. (ex Semelilucina semeliformis)]MCU7829893.1 prepilin-type N-terminal cleavage/methylation domain-containing protein [Candidatus Thiodiazotropha sp. (ex Myrtea sp. 'scaly one' KF741663)]
MRKSDSGVTLIELMVTLAILAILVTIGYPLYTDMLEKSRRSDARAGLSKLAMAQEKYAALFGTYADTIVQLNFGPDGLNDDSNDVFFHREAVAGISADNYTFALVTDGVATTMDFTFSATEGVAQASDDCSGYSIDQTGLKSANYEGAADVDGKCW